MILCVSLAYWDPFDAGVCFHVGALCILYRIVNY